MAQQQPLPFSVDQILAKEVPKLFQLADDMHAMAGYMNDLRIVAILGTVLGIGGGVIFLIVKYCQKKKSDGYDVCPQTDLEAARRLGKQRPVHSGAYAPVHGHWQAVNEVADIESKLAVRLPPENLVRNGDHKHGQGKSDVANV